MSTPLRPPIRRLMPIGGAEDKLGRARILRRFVAEAGGKESRILVCATASALGAEIEELYEKVFAKLGVGEVSFARPGDRRAADRSALAEATSQATGVFFTGGNQTKLSKVIKGTAFGDAVTAAYRDGVLVGGTSAGASIVSEHMIAFGSSGATPKLRQSALAQGLGLLPGVIVDQHFSQRDRFGRLISLVAASPDLLGIGLDEDTALLISNETVMEVLGKGAVFCVDLRDGHSNAESARGTDPLLVSGASVHFLPATARFDLTTRRLISYDGHLANLPEPAELPPAPPALARVSRLVAAEGVDDSVVARNARRRRSRANTSPLRTTTP
ncbi:MAG: cyanophycinase [Candidatus Nanopelagicales bacterium]